MTTNDVIVPTETNLINWKNKEAEVKPFNEGDAVYFMLADEIMVKGVVLKARPTACMVAAGKGKWIVECFRLRLTQYAPKI